MNCRLVKNDILKCPAPILEQIRDNSKLRSLTKTSSIRNNRSSLSMLLSEDLIDLVVEEQDSDAKYVYDELKSSILQL